jgi:polar amino acid transport system substrate-binding protein
MVRTILIGLTLCVLAGATRAEETRTIRIATEGAFPPFNYVENNEPQGFEIELGKAMCEAAKADCVFVLHDWDGIVKGLVKGEYDAIMASLAITERRKTRIAFSKPYYRIPATFIARKEDEFPEIGPQALAGKTIGTTAESEHARFLEERYPDSTVRTYTKFEDANLDLVADRIDLVLGDKIAMMGFLASREGQSCCHFVADAPLDKAFYTPGVAVGLRKDDQGLKALFDGALDAIVANGTYDRIRAKYFAFDVKG